MNVPTLVAIDDHRNVGNESPSRATMLANSVVVCDGDFCMDGYEDMPSWRKLWDTVLYSLDVDAMPDDFTRLFWVMLPLALTRDGTALALPGYLKSKLFPLREDVSHEKVQATMDWLAERKLIRYYEVAGARYIQQLCFAKDQGKRGKEATSPFPPPPDMSTGLVNGQRVVEERSGVEENRIEVEENKKDVYKKQQDINIHPAVLIFYEVNPDVKLSYSQSLKVTKVSSDLEEWRECVEEWAGRGYRLNDVNGMLEWYYDGIPNSKKELIDDQEWIR